MRDGGEMREEKHPVDLFADQTKTSRIYNKMSEKSTILFFSLHPSCSLYLALNQGDDLPEVCFGCSCWVGWPPRRQITSKIAVGREGKRCRDPSVIGRAKEK